MIAAPGYLARRGMNPAVRPLTLTLTADFVSTRFFRKLYLLGPLTLEGRFVFSLCLCRLSVSRWPFCLAPFFLFFDEAATVLRQYETISIIKYTHKTHHSNFPCGQ